VLGTLADRFHPRKDGLVSLAEYHKESVLQDTLLKPGTPLSAQIPPPLVKDSTVSPQALDMFRLIQRLSRRAGYACVNFLETLAEMFKRSLRATRYALAELIAAGWIERTQTRKGGKSKLFFRPLVSVAGRARGLFSARPVAGCVAGYSPSKLQVTPSTPIKKTPVGKEDNNTARSTGDSPEPCPDKGTNLHVAVSILKEICSDSEALELAREASRQKLTEDQVKRVIAAYRGQLKNIRSKGAWLREALRRGFAPAAPTSDHPSENNERPVRVIAAPPGWELPGEGHGAPKTRAARVSSSASPAPSIAPSGNIPREIPPMASAGVHGGNEGPRGLAQLRATIEALKVSASAAS
jgi:hypothetical protein